MTQHRSDRQHLRDIYRMHLGHPQHRYHKEDHTHANDEQELLILARPHCHDLHVAQHRADEHLKVRLTTGAVDLRVQLRVLGLCVRLRVQLRAHGRRLRPCPCLYSKSVLAVPTRRNIQQHAHQDRYRTDDDSALRVTRFLTSSGDGARLAGRRRRARERVRGMNESPAGDE